ncbi:MAG: glycosyltransferase family 2 protein [Gemmatimonadaceae bacterium]
MPSAREFLIGLLLSSPWLLFPMVAVRRQQRSVSLDDYDKKSDVPNPERVSIVLPARNEAEHIVACLETLRATTWPNVEIVVVNDHSTDGTGDLARAVAQNDPRLTVIDAPDLPSGWFGKQWACHCGMQHTTGSLLLFTDADTRHAPDLVARLVHARESRHADLMSVAGAQAMLSFWERAIQPAVFAILLARYGGTVEIENARRSVDVIANGQCFLITRAAYNTIGGHESVKDTVAEDLMIGQRVRAAGLKVSLVIGTEQLSTRMYDGFGTIVRGWMKNVYAGGRLSMPGGLIGRIIFPFILVGGPLFIVAPFIAAIILLVAAAFHITAAPAIIIWSVISTIALLWFLGAINAFAKTEKWRVVFVPIGMIVFAGICAAAVIRGSSVEWKGRTYRAS